MRKFRIEGKDFILAITACKIETTDVNGQPMYFFYSENANTYSFLANEVGVTEM